MVKAEGYDSGLEGTSDVEMSDEDLYGVVAGGGSPFAADAQKMDLSTLMMTLQFDPATPEGIELQEAIESGDIERIKAAQEAWAAQYARDSGDDDGQKDCIIGRTR